MGQAKYTGKLPPEALEAAEQQIGTTEDLRRLINLPEHADFLGYLVFDGETEEFLRRDAEATDKPVRRFSKVPHQAYRFKSFAEANRQAHQSDGEFVVALFDLGEEQLLVAQLFELFDETIVHSYAVH